MIKNSKTGVLITSLIIFASIVLMYFGYTLPGLMALCMAMVYVYCTFGLKKYIVFGIASVLLISVIFSDSEWKSGILSVTSVVIPLLIGEAIRKKYSLYKMMVMSSFAMLVITSSVIIRGMKMYNTSAIQLLFGDELNVLRDAVMNLPEMREQMLEFIDMMWKQLDALLPAYVVLGSAAFVYFIFLAVRVVLEAQGTKVEMRHFYELRLSASFTFIFMFVEIISMTAGENMMIMNAASVLSVIFLVSGLSVIDFYLKIRGVKTPFRIMIYIGGFFSIGFMGSIGILGIQAINFLGMIDSVRPLRKFPSGRKGV